MPETSYSYSTDSVFFSLKLGDKIRSVGFPPITSFVYHVRGRVDDVLIVRQWSHKHQGWNYLVLTSAWFWVYRDVIRIGRTKSSPEADAPLSGPT